MANTIGFGQAAVNNTIDYGQGAIDNTINWGKSQTLSPSGETNITGTGGTPPFSNVNSFSFDGVDDYFTGTSTYSELDGQTKATFSLWIKPTSSSTLIRNVFQIGSGSTGGNGVCQLYLYQGNRIDFSISSASTYGRANISSLNYGSWNHLLIAIDLDITDEFKCYLNGVDVTTSDNLGSRTSFTTATEPLYIGEYTTGAYTPFLGNIDEFAIWSGTDLRNDVATIYNNGTPTDLNNNGLTAPTTWQRMGDLASWNGATWTMTDVNGGYTNRSINMVEANRTTDVPTASSFTNTKSIQLDGVDDYVSIPSNANLQISDSFTISHWIKFTSTSQMYVTNFANKFGTYVQNGSVYLIFRNLSNSQITLQSTSAINDGNWHNVTAIKTSSTMAIYIDGTLNASNANGAVGITSGLSNAIGSLFNGAIPFNGTIDEVAIWSSDQSANASAIGGTIPTDLSAYNPLGWWRCGDGDTAPTLTDNGSGGNDGTMTNFTTFSTDVPT